MTSARSGHHRIHSDERGMALALALIAIIVIGALVTGTFFAGRMEMVAGRNTVYTAQASEAAEVGIAEAFTSWDPEWNKYDVGVSEIQPTVTISLAGGGPAPTKVQYTNTVRRLQGGTFLVTSVGQKVDVAGNVLATRMLAQFGKLASIDIEVEAAVTANAHVQVSGSTTKVDGMDQLPPGWTTECAAPAAGTGVYGIRTSDDVGTSGHPDIDGTPQDTKEHDHTVTSATFTTPFNFLSPLATVVLSAAGGINVYNPEPSVTGSPSKCNKADADNWGEPYRLGGFVSECTTYFPIVYYPGPGTLKLANGRAQGIILSANNIDIAGNFEFDGLMIALGSVDTHGTGNKVSGAIMSGNANITDDDAFGGTPTVTYSSCAIGAALTYNTKPDPLAQRPWAQVYPR